MSERWRGLAARAYFELCRVSGRLLRATRYSTVQIAHQEGPRVVRKRRRVYAPLLIWMSELLIRILDGGVRVLPQREWEERERRIYERLYGETTVVERGGVLLLPRLPGRTLAEWLEDPSLDESRRQTVIECAVVALAEFHRLGFTHADAMAENVLVDLEAGAAYWFDFETVYDPSRSSTWRRADDLRALLVTCLIRTAPEKKAGTLALIPDVYADEDVTRAMAASFASVWRRPLTLHLLQAALSFHDFRDITEWLRARLRDSELRGR